MPQYDLKNVKTVHITFESEGDGRLYDGEFTIKRLSIADYQKQQIRKLQLNGGYHYDSSSPGVGVPRDIDFFNDVVAHLELAVVKAPQWWDLDEITDVGVVYAVHGEVISFENSFLNRGKDDSKAAGEPAGVSEGGGETPPQESQRREDVREVVEQEVLAAPEP